MQSASTYMMPRCACVCIQMLSACVVKSEISPAVSQCCNAGNKPSHVARPCMPRSLEDFPSGTKKRPRIQRVGFMFHVGRARFVGRAKRCVKRTLSATAKCMQANPPETGSRDSSGRVTGTSCGLQDDATLQLCVVRRTGA